MAATTIVFAADHSVTVAHPVGEVYDALADAANERPGFFVTFMLEGEGGRIDVNPAAVRLLQEVT